jgi:hypothetical protein
VDEEFLITSWSIEDFDLTNVQDVVSQGSALGSGDITSELAGNARIA